MLVEILKFTSVHLTGHEGTIDDGLTAISRIPCKYIFLSMPRHNHSKTCVMFSCKDPLAASTQRRRALNKPHNAFGTHYTSKYPW